jgi:hypothetical protein
LSAHGASHTARQVVYVELDVHLDRHHKGSLESFLMYYIAPM